MIEKIVKILLLFLGLFVVYQSWIEERYLSVVVLSIFIFNFMQESFTLIFRNFNNKISKKD